MTRAVSPSPGSWASSAASAGGPALRLRGLTPATAHAYKPNLFDVCMLAFTIVVGGQYFNWNATLAAGLIPATTALFLVGAAYIVLMFSLAEVASVFPFAGGAYAIARKTLGFFGGFLVGAIDAIEFVLYVSASVLALADMIVTSIPDLRGLEPALWALFYLSATLLQTRSHRVFWRFTMIAGLASVLILLVFCFGSLSKTDIRRYTVSVIDVKTKRPVDQPRFTDMLRVLPFCAWFYVGADAIVLVADHVHEPRALIPQAQRISIVLLFVTAMLTFFVTASLPPGMATLAEAAAPLSFGFAQFASLSVQHAGWLSFPATYATAFGFLWAYGRLFTALASSRLLPKWLIMRITHQSRQNHGLSCRTAVGIGSFLSFVVCLIVHYTHDDHQRLSRACMGFAFLSYIGQTLGYLILRSNVASGSKRAESLAHASYRSPFGELGACFALMVWVIGLLSVVAFQDARLEEIAILGSVLFGLGIYYHVYAQHHQLISIDERGVTIAAATNASPKTSARVVTQQSSILSQTTPGPPRAAASIHSSDTKSHTSEGDGSGYISPQQARMPELVKAGSKFNNLLEEHPGLTDDMEVPYIPNWPPQPQPPQSASVSRSNPPPMLGSIRRAGSDGVLTCNTERGGGGGGLVMLNSALISGGIGWGRSFLAGRAGRLERLREETERDLRSALSGIWSERSRRWSRGRGDK